MNIDNLPKMAPWVYRVLEDSWCFGITLITGEKFAFRTIDNIILDATDILWFQLNLMTDDNQWLREGYKGAIAHERPHLWIRYDHIVSYCELADT